MSQVSIVCPIRKKNVSAADAVRHEDKKMS